VAEMAACGCLGWPAGRQAGKGRQWLGRAGQAGNALQLRRCGWLHQASAVAPPQPRHMYCSQVHPQYLAGSLVSIPGSLLLLLPLMLRLTVPTKNCKRCRCQLCSHTRTVAQAKFNQHSPCNYTIVESTQCENIDWQGVYRVRTEGKQAKTKGAKATSQ